MKTINPKERWLDLNSPYLQPKNKTLLPENSFRILVVDDEREIVESISRVLIEEGYQVDGAYDSSMALKMFEQRDYNVVLLDIVMPGIDGIELMKELMKNTSHPEVILITGHGTIESAVEAMKIGAYHYLTKPFDNIVLKTCIRNIYEKHELLNEIDRLKAQTKDLGPFYPDMIGISRPIRRLYRLLSEVIEADCNVLISGESGTGKEVVARILHKHGNRKFGPFVPVNCQALPELLIESELFGYEKGAFTGANHLKIGYFEAADRGIIFLDEITEIPEAMQVKLLRFIQDKKLVRLGSTKQRKIDVRIVAATNKDIEDLMKRGLFREDLYYRLNVVRLNLPPLRNRGGDIILLANHFLRVLSETTDKNIQTFHASCYETFMQYHWPGNIRELRNVVEHAVTLCQDRVIHLSDLSENLNGGIQTLALDQETLFHLPLLDARQEILRTFYTDYISCILKECGGNMAKASEKLEVSRSYLYKLINRYEIGLEPKSHSIKCH